MFGFDSTVASTSTTSSLHRWMGDTPFNDYEGMIGHIEDLYKRELEKRKLMYKFFTGIPFYSNPKSVKNNWSPWFNEPDAIKKARRLGGISRSVFNWIAGGDGGYVTHADRSPNLLPRVWERVERNILTRKPLPVGHWGCASPLEEPHFISQTSGNIKKNKKCIKSYYEFILMAIGMSYSGTEVCFPESSNHSAQPWRGGSALIDERPFRLLNDAVWKNKPLHQYLSLEKEPQLPTDVLIRIFTDKDKEYQEKEKKRIENIILANFPQ